MGGQAPRFLDFESARFQEFEIRLACDAYGHHVARDVSLKFRAVLIGRIRAECFDQFRHVCNLRWLFCLDEGQIAPFADRCQAFSRNDHHADSSRAQVDNRARSS